MNRLKYFRKLHKYQQKDVAEYLGLTTTAYGHYETGRRQISADNLARLAKFYECTVDDLLGISEDNPEWQTVEEKPEIVPEEEVNIPLVASLRCGLDTQGVPFTYIKSVPVPISYVRRWGEDLRLIMAVGDSMSPTIIPEDMLVCKPTDAWESGQVVVANVNDCDMVKRIFRTEDGGIELRSDNPTYPVLHFTPEELAEDCVHVLGRVMIPIPKEL